MSRIYDPYAPAEAYPPRSNHNMGRSMERPPQQMRPPPQVNYNQPPQAQYSQPSSDMDYHRSGSATMMPAPSSSANSIFPRSASEALFDTTSKFRQLPCRTFISVGTCPYRERCVYLHDPRCICKEAKTKTRRKNKEDVVLDALFWPVMPYPMVAAKLDMNRQPHVIQSYSVPLPQPDQYRKHDMSVYSMWMHFVDFCLATSESGNVRHADSAPCFSAPDVPINSYTDEARLKFFQFLSSCNGRPVSREELIHATSVSSPAAARQFGGAANQRRHLQQQQQQPEEASNPYFSSSESPLADVMEPNMRSSFYGNGGVAPAAAPIIAQRQSVSPSFPLQDRDSFSQHRFSEHTGLKVNTSAPYDPRAGRASFASQSVSPVTVAATERSPHRTAPSAVQSRVAIGGALGALGAIGVGGSNRTSPTAADSAPTSLSLLLSTVPQANLSQSMDPAKLGKMQIMSQSDPWLERDSFGLTDEERDSGSSFNSELLQDFRSLWKDTASSSSSSAAPALFNEESAAHSLGMLHDLM